MVRTNVIEHVLRKPKNGHTHERGDDGNQYERSNVLSTFDHLVDVSHHVNSLNVDFNKSIYHNIRQTVK